MHKPSTGFVSKHDVIAAKNVSSVKAVNDGGGLGGGGLGGDDDEHPKDSVIAKLDAPFPPVSVRYPSLIVTVYSPRFSFRRRRRGDRYGHCPRISSVCFVCEALKGVV